ncbi:variant erythrocyte surface antigen-1 family protein [Babesia caballi]|uniref:Variant erythrocyte surface antigen-1 family protein n=1 Tax=Babesia caballi TaxID=5871 RepID=A0AAV4LRS0_BABCB|nr:variant erythrocyte surface antigen-1 family protein [Babesia caballi]
MVVRVVLLRWSSGSRVIDLGKEATWLRKCAYVALRYIFIRPCRPFSCDCPSNLKEAIDWVLRVTGKDGQDSGGASDSNVTKLAEAITKLEGFDSAIKAAADKVQESGSIMVSQALEKLSNEGNLGQMIGKLADGFRGFIGYGGNNGIALVIDPLQQLRKGVLMFLSEVIIKLASRSNLTAVINNNEVNNALNKAFSGKDNVSFDDAIAKVREVKESGGQKIPDIVGALKNIADIQSKNNVNGLAKGFEQYLTRLLTAISSQAPSQVASLKNSLPALVEAYGNRRDIDGQMKTVESENNKINRNGSRNVGEILGSAVHNGTKYLLEQLKKDGYKSSYSSTLTWMDDPNNTKFAQIFLGCLPLYYYWLTYLYWKCKQPQAKGGWETQWFSGRGGGVALKNFIVGQGYNASHLNTKNGSVRGSHIATLIQSIGLSSATAAQSSHTDLLNALRKGLEGVLNVSGTNVLNGHSLSALFYLCHNYFTGKHIMQSGSPKFKPRAPTSIREMLYWLSGLQFSPHYSTIEKQIAAYIPGEGLHVADSSITSSTGPSGDTLTQSQMKGFLLSSCLSAPGVLGAIQGNSADMDGEPWLYNLFCNSMNLMYPSGPALFNTLANYAYALQFQLHFLYIQCRTNYNQSYGWQWCRYGQSAQLSGDNFEELASWICTAPDCSSGYRCPHNSTACDHIKNCGHNTYSSPLQAFLTDNLKGFHVSSKPSPDSTHHLENHPPNYMCHVPMGFTSALTKDPNATGWYIYYLLDHFCGGFNTPLRQLCEKFGCLTKRTPRTLGDLFGFLWHLNGQLFGTQQPTLATMADRLMKALGSSNSNVPGFLLDLLKLKASHLSSSGPVPTALSRSLEAMAPSIPFLYQLFMSNPKNFLPRALFDLKGATHKSLPSHSADLFSLQNPECTGPNCGTYLSPLCYASGSAFAPQHASSYFSWVLYLIDDLQSWFQAMLDEFTNIDCTKLGCHERKCQSHAAGTHGATSSSQCTCDSVVHCAGALPLLYSNGFTFASASMLKNGGGQSSGKKTCQNFHDQLSAVLAQNESTPLFKLLLTIDEFLYMFRFYFFYNLLSFWIMYVCIVLYIYFLRADLLHLKSHVHFPSSHGIPPIGLLTTGKSTILTKLTYYMP